MEKLHEIVWHILIIAGYIYIKKKYISVAKVEFLKNEFWKP